MRQTTSTYDYGQRTTRNINTTVRLRVLYCRKLPTYGQRERDERVPNQNQNQAAGSRQAPRPGLKRDLTPTTKIGFGLSHGRASLFGYANPPHVMVTICVKI
jgi:hypothetical protein